MTIRKLSLAQRDRLVFIELRVRFLGDIRRHDLIARFGIQVAAATRDLSLYRDLAPQNLEYDPKEKVYKQAAGFRPLFDISADRVLTWLSRGYGDSGPERAMPVIPISSANPVHMVSLDVLSPIAQAIHQRKVISVDYRSMTSGLSSRDFVPFALADNGFRWHIRGFDRKRRNFIDLILTRIASARILEGEIEEAEMPEQDIQWNRIVELELVPHPINVKYPETVEADHGFSGVLHIRVRAALAGYLLRRWNVDCSQNHDRRGSEFHLWLRNSPTLYGVTNLRLAPGYEPVG